MISKKTISVSLVFFLASIAFGQSGNKLTPVTFEKVKMEDNFWLPRLKRQKTTLVSQDREMRHIAQPAALCGIRPFQGNGGSGFVARRRA